MVVCKQLMFFWSRARPDSRIYPQPTTDSIKSTFPWKSPPETERKEAPNLDTLMSDKRNKQEYLVRGQQQHLVNTSRGDSFRIVLNVTDWWHGMWKWKVRSGCFCFAVFVVAARKFLGKREKVLTKCGQGPEFQRKRFVKRKGWEMRLNFPELDEIIFASHFSPVCLSAKDRGGGG